MRAFALLSLLSLAACGGFRDLSGDYTATAVRTPSMCATAPPAVPTDVTVHVVRDEISHEHMFTFVSGSGTCTAVETNCGDFSCLAVTSCAGGLAPAGWTYSMPTHGFLEVMGSHVLFSATWHEPGGTGCTVTDDWTLQRD